MQEETFDICPDDGEFVAISSTDSLFEWPKDERVTPFQAKILSATSPLQTKVTELQEDLKDIKQVLSIMKTLSNR